MEITAGANSTPKHKKKQKKKKKEKKYRQSRINENADDSRPLRLPENSHHELSSLKRRIPKQHLQEGCDDDDVVARTKPRVSLGMREGCGKEEPRRPSRRNGGAHERHRVGVSHPTRISPVPPENHDPGHFIVLRQPRHPPACATTALQSPAPSHRGRQNETSRQEESQPRTIDNGTTTTQEGPASTAACGYRPDAST
jgi:hypothetical protein